MKLLALCIVLLLSAGCASIVEKCHEFSKWVDIKAIDCAEQEPEKK